MREEGRDACIIHDVRWIDEERRNERDEGEWSQKGREKAKRNILSGVFLGRTGDLL